MGGDADGIRKPPASYSTGAAGLAVTKGRASGTRSPSVGAGRAKGAGAWLHNPGASSANKGARHPTASAKDAYDAYVKQNGEPDCYYARKGIVNLPNGVALGSRSDPEVARLVKAKKLIILKPNQQLPSPPTPLKKEPDTFPGSARTRPDHLELGMIVAAAPPKASAPSAPTPQPAPSKFERFAAAAWGFGKQAVAFDAELGAHLLHSAGFLSAQDARKASDVVNSELGVDRDTSAVRALAVSAKHSLEALPEEARKELVNLGGAVVEGGAKGLEAVGAVDEKKTEALIDARYVAHGLNRQDNGVRNAAVGAAKAVGRKVEEASLAQLELNIRAGVAAHIIDPAAGKKVIDEAYQAAGLTPKDNEVREAGKKVVQFAIDMEKIKTGTEAGAAIMLVRELRARGRLSAATAFAWEKKIGEASRVRAQRSGQDRREEPSNRRGCSRIRHGCNP